jgi:hypothetical protein
MATPTPSRLCDIGIGGLKRQKKKDSRKVFERNEVRTRVSFRRAELKSFTKSALSINSVARHKPAALTTRPPSPLVFCLILQNSGLALRSFPDVPDSLFLPLMRSFGFAEWPVCSGYGFDSMRSSCRHPSRMVNGVCRVHGVPG